MQISNNLQAFLDMISHSEGTDRYPNDGYNTIVGGSQFVSFADHPRCLITVNKKGLKSTAAGRYQLLSKYFDFYKEKLKLHDFSPASQDAIAIQQIRERKALNDIEAGRIVTAISKIKNIWASLPGAGYGQRECKIEDLVKFYVECGGTTTEKIA